MSSVLLTYVFPSLGCVLSLSMFSSSLVAVLKVRQSKRLGRRVLIRGLVQELNPLPYAGILGQTSGQVIYGSIISNWFIFWANFPGLLMGVWLTLSTIVHATPKVQNLMTACIIIVAAYYSSIALVTTHIQAPQDTKNKIWGAAGALALVAYYTAPLSTLIKVVRRKDSSSLHAPLCIMNFVNMCMWLSYGLAIKNPFIWVPETIGGTLSISALVLLLAYPRRERQRARLPTPEEPPVDEELSEICQQRQEQQQEQQQQQQQQEQDQQQQMPPEVEVTQEENQQS